MLNINLFIKISILIIYIKDIIQIIMNIFNKNFNENIYFAFILNSLTLILARLQHFWLMHKFIYLNNVDQLF